MEVGLKHRGIKSLRSLQGIRRDSPRWVTGLAVTLRLLRTIKLE